MANVNYTVVLDLTDNGCVQTGWRLKQGDSGNSTIIAKVVNNGVDAYDPNVTPEIAFKRADGNSVLSTMTASDGYYNYTFVGNELAVAGPVVMDVTFTDEEARTSTASCRFEVVADPAGYDPEGAHTYDNPVSVLVGRATEDALIAEGFAVGQQRGQDVQETSPYYHNNAKYYSDLTDPTALRNMSDVDVEGVQNGQILKWNSTTEKWENANESGGGASLPIDISDNTNNVTGVLNTVNGGTGNNSGYVRAGQKANTTIGTGATAEGTYTTASGLQAHAEGNGTTASGNFSPHAEGYYTTASGDYSHAEGNATTARGVSSHAEGNNTIANAHYSHVQGKWNEADNDNTYAHIVGNGTGSNARSNAHTLDWSGNAWFAGTVTDGTGNVLSNKQDALPTVVNDRYLHTNASTGALEWAQVQGGGSSATILTGTLTAGNTTITFTDNAITATALIDIYTDDPDVGWESRSVAGTTLTITFPEQVADLSVKVRIESGV